MLIGCGGGGAPADASSAPAGEGAAAASGASEPTLLPLPGEPSAQERSSTGVVAGPLVWDAPESWVQETPRSMMRRAQYRIPGEDGDGECVVYYFGPGQGGDPQANAARWAGQFIQPDGSSSLDKMQVSRLEGGRLPLQLVEVTGTYDGGMTMTDAPAEARPDYMLLGGIAMAADAPWFFKFTGPESTVRANRAAFVAMLESLRVGS
jgi:hypothetical protein